MTLQERWDSVMMNNYGTPAIALASGDGAVVTDENGKAVPYEETSPSGFVELALGTLARRLDRTRQRSRHPR